MSMFVQKQGSVHIDLAEYALYFFYKNPYIRPTPT